MTLSDRVDTPRPIIFGPLGSSEVSGSCVNQEGRHAVSGHAGVEMAFPETWKIWGFQACVPLAVV